VNMFLFRLASSFATAEGWFSPDPNAAPRRNRNPGNLTDPKTGKFRVFKTDQEGIAWLYHQLALDIRRGFTLRQLTTKYAPPSENDTESYIRETARRMGIKLTGNPPDSEPLWNFLRLERIP